MELAQLVEAFAVKKSKTGVKAMITRMRTKTSRTTRITRFSLSLSFPQVIMCVRETTIKYVQIKMRYNIGTMLKENMLGYQTRKNQFALVACRLVLFWFLQLMTHRSDLPLSS
jgi:hypothetical protein